jgi:hypothetical protein
MIPTFLLMVVGKGRRVVSSYMLGNPWSVDGQTLAITIDLINAPTARWVCTEWKL